MSVAGAYPCQPCQPWKQVRLTGGERTLQPETATVALPVVPLPVSVTTDHVHACYAGQYVANQVLYRLNIEERMSASGDLRESASVATHVRPIRSFDVYLVCGKKELFLCSMTEA